MSDVDPATEKRRAPGLGRGLSALMGDLTPDATAIATGGVRQLPIADVFPNREQPRRHFDEDALTELADSIQVRGVLQPIVVREWDQGFQIVAGERRWRAAQRAQLHTIPAIVREFDASEMLEIGLIENIQREELSAIEEGEAYRRLVDDHGHRIDGLAKLLNKSRSHVANLVRLVELSPKVRDMVVDRRLSMGHARALLGYEHATALAERIVAEGLSVRAVEAIVKKAKKLESPPSRPASAPEANADISLLERQLSDLLGLKVAIGHRDGGGSVTVTYATLDQLDLICKRLSAGAV